MAEPRGVWCSRLHRLRRDYDRGLASTREDGSGCWSAVPRSPTASASMATSSSGGPWRRRSRTHSTGTRAGVWGSGNGAGPFWPKRAFRCHPQGSKPCLARRWNAWLRSAPRTGRRCSDSRKRGTAGTSDRRSCSRIAATANHPARGSDSGPTSCIPRLREPANPPSGRYLGVAARTSATGVWARGLSVCGGRPASPTSLKMAGGACLPLLRRRWTFARLGCRCAMTAQGSRTAEAEARKRDIRCRSAKRAGVREGNGSGVRWNGRGPRSWRMGLAALRPRRPREGYWGRSRLRSSSPAARDAGVCH